MDFMDALLGSILDRQAMSASSPGMPAPAVAGFAILLGCQQAGDLAPGTVSHCNGAARALQVHPDAGAFAGLAFALQVLAALPLPLAMRL